jgi:hypothetical protein
VFYWERRELSSQRLFLAGWSSCLQHLSQQDGQVAVLAFHRHQRTFIFLAMLPTKEATVALVDGHMENGGILHCLQMIVCCCTLLHSNSLLWD